MGAGLEFATDVGRGVTTLQAFPEEILLDPELNGRKDLPDIEGLAADIEKNGQDQPVVCRKDDHGNPVLVFGHRRYRAIVLINERNPSGRRKINFIYKRMNETEAFTAAIRENRFRKEVSDPDHAHNMEILQRRFNMTEEDIARIYFPEAANEKELKAALRWVKDRLALVELSPEAEQAVRAGRVKGISAAKGLAKLSRDQQKKRLEKQGNITAADVSKRKKPAKKKIEPKLMELLAAVLDSADFEKYDERKTKQICVEAEALVTLKNYVTPEGK